MVEASDQSGTSEERRARNQVASTIAADLQAESAAPAAADSVNRAALEQRLSSWDSAGDAAYLSSPDDASFGFQQRSKALALTAPLHDLDARKTQVQQADFSVYLMADLALHAIDLVTVAMDFDTGARQDVVEADLVQLVAAQAPDRSLGEHARVASWVVNHLLNVGSVDRGFQQVYGITGPSGFERRMFNFKLLEETRGHDGETYLRTSTEAVNVLVGALDLDLADAARSADLRLEALIKLGKLSDAQTAAQTARYRTIQYGESLRLKLDATSRNVRNVDWVDEMPAFLEEALQHIEGRSATEHAILSNLADIRDTTTDVRRKKQAVQLIVIVKDCLRRHDQLAAGLQAAGRRFRAEQDRQTFAPQPVRAALDLHGQLLVPALECSVEQAEKPLLSFFSVAVGLRVPAAVRLVDLYEALITPPGERELLGAEVEDPDVEEVEVPPRFPPASYEHLAALLELDPEVPQRLSGMLVDARERQTEDPRAEDLPLLVVVRVLALAAQEIGTARLHQDPYVMLAVDDGARLEDVEFAGADLLVSRAEVLHDAHDEDGDEGQHSHTLDPAGVVA